MESSQAEISSPKAQKRKKSNMGAKNKQKNQAVSAIHGNMYQLKLLMLFLYRGVTLGYSFRLGTEVEEAEKFDDLMFEYTQNGKKVYRLLQAKHKLGEESKKIKARHLLKETNGDYNLTKYCKSYLSSKESDLFKDGLIKDVIICTNIDFDLESLNKEQIRVEKIEDEDDILDVVVGNKQPQRYRISQELAILDKIKEFSVDEVKDFLDHLVFAVNQPNEEELEIIIKEEIGKEFDFDSKTKEDVYNKLFVTMLNWFKGKGDRFFSSEEGKKFFEEAKRGMPIWFGVRYPVESFVGRDEQLDNLHRMLQSGDTTVKSHVVSINGLGGIGKSELARMYIYEHSQDYDDKIIWINAENYQTLAESFSRLACDKLGMCTKNPNGEEKEMKSIVEDVYNFFSHGKSLFVFDNAEKYQSQNEFDCGINTFLHSRPPSNKNRPYILITSRNQKWPKNIKALTLDVFIEEEAIEFIKNSLGIQNDAEDREIKDISKELQYFPLALQQAVSYIRVQDEKMKNVRSAFKIGNYLEMFREKTKKLLNFEFPEDSDNEYTKTTYITWNVTLKAIRQKENGEGEDALEILNIISYLGSENIPIEILLKSAHDEEKLGSAIELLKQYSMVNSEHGMLNIHRLVQHVTRIKLENQKKEEDTLRNVLELFKEVNVSLKIVDHAIIAWNYSSRYGKLIEEFPYIPSYISNELMNSGRYEEAYSFELKVLGTQQFFLNKDHPNIFNTKTRIAGVLLKQGKYDEAFKANQELLTIKRESLKENHPDVLRIRYHLAEIQRQQGKYDEALKAFTEIFKQEKNAIGDYHPHTLTTQYSLAFTLDNQGKDTEALKNYEEVFKKREIILGKDHTDTLQVRNQIAKIFSKQGNYDTAFQMYQEIFAVQKRVLGLNNWDTQATKNNMGMVLYYRKEYDKALKIFQEVFNTLQIISPNHPDTLYPKNNIALVLSSQGKNEEALKIFREILPAQETIIGTEHHECTKTKCNIAKLLHNQGKHYEALKYFQEVLDGFNKVLGLENEETLEVSDIIQSLMVLPEIQINIVKKTDFNILRNNLKLRITLNSKDNDGFTLLHHAVNNGNSDMVQFLLKNGADVNQITIVKGNTPLHIATVKGFKEIIEILLKHASRNKLNEFINAKTTSAGTTSLHVAVKKGFLEIVISLLKHGAIYDIKNKEGKMPLDLSNDHNISKLLELTAELFVGTENGNDCIIKKLKELEPEKFAAVTSARNNEGHTLLEVARINKHENIERNLSEILNTTE